jgi:hypothetical protein
MNPTINGMIAGFVATLVLSALMFVKGTMGSMPQLDVITVLSRMAGATHVAGVGWLLHFLIGAVAWGMLFAWLAPSLPGGSDWVKGVIFGAGAWLLMMIAVMPMAGAGLFGMSLGMVAPAMTLMLHLVFGAVLGFTYQKLPSSGRTVSA